MKKWQIMLLITFVMIPIVYGSVQCEISTDNSTWVDIDSTKYGGCIDEISKMAYAQNLDAKEDYYFRCRNETTSWGYLKQKTGRINNMETAMVIILLSINLIVFALPFWVRFSNSESANYVIKRIMWMTSILLLWFNMTIFRTMAENYGLGIDNFLETYWWMLTLATFSIIFIMCYVMVVGVIKLTKEATMRKRIGDDYEEPHSNHGV